MGSKSLFNMILFIVIITIFLFLFMSPDIHGFRTPQQYQNSPNSRILVTPNPNNSSNNHIDRIINNDRQPILISPSNVYVITPDNRKNITILDNMKSEPVSKRGFGIGNRSPTDSIEASTVFEVPIEFPSNLNFESDNNKKTNFIFDETNRKFKYIGEKLCCKIFEEWLYNKYNKNIQVQRNVRPDFLRNPKVINPTKRNNLELDMVYGNIAIEYNGLQHSKFVAKYHDSNEDFLKQISNDQAKVKICKDVGIELIIIDCEVDSLKIDNNGKKKYLRLSQDERERKIREKLIPLLDEAYNRSKV